MREHVLPFFESVQPDDPRPRRAIEHARAWVRGEVTMMQARSAGGQAMGAARDLRGAARHAAYAAGQAGAVAHVAAHELGAAAYAIQVARAAAPDGAGEAAGRRECQWQRDQLRQVFVSSCSTTSGCGTTSVGRHSTAEPATSASQDSRKAWPAVSPHDHHHGSANRFHHACPVPLRRRGRVRRDRRRGGRPRRGRDDRRGRPGRLAAAELRHHGEHVGVFDGDRLVAYGDFSDTDVAYTAVLPSYQGRGLGTAIARWLRGDRAGRGVDADRHPGSAGQCGRPADARPRLRGAVDDGTSGSRRTGRSARGR